MKNKIYEIFESELAATKPSKAAETKIKILEATIEYLCRDDISNVTYLHIAEYAGLSKQLVQKYFPSKNELFYLVFVYIRTSYQMYVVEQIKKQTTSENQLRAYIQYALSWAIDRKAHAIVWTLLWNFAAKDEKFSKLFHSFEMAGQARIEALLRAHFKKDSLSDAELKAKAAILQRYLIGSIVHLGLTKDPGDHQTLVNEFTNQSLSLIALDLK